MFIWNAKEMNLNNHKLKQIILFKKNNNLIGYALLKINRNKKNIFYVLINIY